MKVMGHLYFTQVPRVKQADVGKFVELPGAEMGKVVTRFPPEASGSVCVFTVFSSSVFCGHGYHALAT